jgi:hypothetical protein
MAKGVQMLEMENRRLHADLVRSAGRTDALETQMRMYNSFFMNAQDMEEEDD